MITHRQFNRMCSFCHRRYWREHHLDKFAVWCGLVQLGLLVAGLGIAIYWKRKRDRWLRDDDGIEFNEVSHEKEPLLKSV